MFFLLKSCFQQQRPFWPCPVFWPWEEAQPGETLGCASPPPPPPLAPPPQPPPPLPSPHRHTRTTRTPRQVARIPGHVTRYYCMSDGLNIVGWFKLCYIFSELYAASCKIISAAQLGALKDLNCLIHDVDLLLAESSELFLKWDGWWDRHPGGPSSDDIIHLFPLLSGSFSFHDWN